MNKNSKITTLFTYVLIILVAILLAFNYRLFIVANKFAPAGLNGISTMIQHKTGFSIGYMSLLINIPLCIISFFWVNKSFGIRSFVFCMTYSFVYLYLQKLSFLDQFVYDAQGHDTIFPVLISGILSGVVYGMCFRTNSSTGGTDILSKFIHKFKPEFNFFWVRFTLNAIVAAASFFVYAEYAADGSIIVSYKPVCLCILYCFVASYYGDFMTKGTKIATKFTIITTHPEEIMKEVTENFRHSSTKIQAVGSFSQDQKSILICVINKHQLVDFSKMLKKYDNTFSFSETVNETYGNFKKIK